MINKNELKVLIYFFLTIILTSANITCISLDVSSPSFTTLIEDMKRYKQITRPPGPIHAHAGDLYEHSLWVEQVIAEWSAPGSEDSESFWCEGVSEKDLTLMAFAGFLHDVGKGGNCCYEGYESKFNGYDELINVEYERNCEHPRIGFEYLYYQGDNRQRVYKLCNNNQVFDFDKLFVDFNVTSEERTIIAILVGIHWHFGAFVVSRWKSRDHDQLAHRFLESLDALVKETQYNQGKIDERLLRMAILIGAADVKGSRPSTGTKTYLFKEVIKKDATHETICEGYKTFGFQEYGRQAHDYVIEYFKNHWNHDVVC